MRQAATVSMASRPMPACCSGWVRRGCGNCSRLPVPSRITSGRGRRARRPMWRLPAGHQGGRAPPVVGAPFPAWYRSAGEWHRFASGEGGLHRGRRCSCGSTGRHRASCRCQHRRPAQRQQDVRRERLEARHIPGQHRPLRADQQGALVADAAHFHPALTVGGDGIEIVMAVGVQFHRVGKPVVRRDVRRVCGVRSRPCGGKYAHHTFQWSRPGVHYAIASIVTHLGGRTGGASMACRAPAASLAPVSAHRLRCRPVPVVSPVSS